jgi:hypothetical protein
MATANKLALLQKIKWEKAVIFGSFSNDLTKQKEMREVEVAGLAEPLGMAVAVLPRHCGGTYERGHW